MISIFTGLIIAVGLFIICVGILLPDVEDELDSEEDNDGRF